MAKQKQVRSKKKKMIMDYLMIFFGAAVVAFGVSSMYDPAGLVTGGFSGLAIIVKSVTSRWFDGGIPLWFTNVALNVPVFILAYFIKGRKFIGKTLVGTLALSFWLYVLPSVDLAQGDLLLASLFGGVFTGLGIGFVIRAGATTGGTDMVSAIIQVKLRHYSIVQILQVIDGLVVVAGLFVFGIRAALYAIIAIVVATKVSDIVLEGLNYSKAVYIVTKEHDLVADKILYEMERGVTGLQAKGMYTKEDKCVLYCVVNQKELVPLKDMVAEADPHAFVIVADVREVLGEGFQEHMNDF